MSKKTTALKADYVDLFKVSKSESVNCCQHVWTISGKRPNEVKMEALHDEYDDVWKTIQKAIDSSELSELAISSLMKKYGIALDDAFSFLIGVKEATTYVYFGRTINVRDWRNVVQPLCQQEASKLKVNSEFELH